MSESGDTLKKDDGKVRYELIPADALYELAKIYTKGATKYPDPSGNGFSTWHYGMAWSRIFGALLRHAWAWYRGEKFDPTDGQPHMASVAWNALTLLAYEMREVGTDDRPHKDKE